MPLLQGIFPSHETPPIADRLYSKLRSVFADAHVHIAFIVNDIVASIWYCFSIFRKCKIVIKNLDGGLFMSIFSPIILEIADIFLLFTVDRYHGVSVCYIRFDRGAVIYIGYFHMIFKRV